MSLPDNPITRGEVFLNAVANNDASGLPAPITRQEEYLAAIASGDASNIPASPVTREEQYLDYIAQNGGGGGGGSDTLFDCTWLKEYGSLAEINGNTVTFSSGGSSHYVTISSPANIDRSRRIGAGHTVTIAIEVKAVSLYISLNGGTGTTTQSGNLWTVQANGIAYTNKTGKTILTFIPSGDTAGIKIFAGNQTSDFNTATGTIEITGLKYDNTLIFGDVTPPSA